MERGVGSMNRIRQRGIGRLAGFAAFLLICAAVPVFADPAQSDPATVAEELPAGAMPDGGQVAEGLRKAEAEEEAAEAQLESPRAAEEREESVEAFADVSPSEAAALVKAEFPEALAAIEHDPARALSDVAISEVLSPTSALITVDGKTELMEGTLPVRAPEENGDLRKVNLDLVAGDEGFEQVNPLTEVTLGESAAEGISVGDENLVITPEVTQAPSSGQPFGDKDVFYPETQTDTDTLAMPIASGVELFSQLRSVQSPEELRFAVEFPQGATLSMDGEGNAEVAREGEILARIPAPTASDAQGKDVPVQMGVEGNSLVLHVAHREMDVAYPLLVDPIAEDWSNHNWHDGYNLSALSNGTWAFRTNDWGRYTWSISSPTAGLVGGSEKGLFARYYGGSGTLPAEHFAEYSYTAPGTTTWISDVGINPLWRFNYGCGSSSYPQPHDYVGLWNDYWGWTTPVQIDPSAATYAIVTAPRNDWHEKIGRVLIFGLGTGTGGPADPCTRDLYAGGAYIWMDDPENPSLDPISGYPTGWFDDSKLSGVTVAAHDPGLGVQNIYLNIAGKEHLGLKTTNCSGLRGDPCPADMGGTIAFNGDNFGEGKSEAKVVANDALAKASGVASWTPYVDNTPPEIELSGQLARATKEENGDANDPTGADKLSLPVYKLEIKATDGSKANEQSMRSGVKNIEIFLDEKTEPETVSWKAQGCSGPSYSCPMTEPYALDLSGLTAGKHVLKVVAVDQLEHKRIREIQFKYVPATGIKDEDVMQYFPLPDGKGNEAEEEHPSRPELAVNVMNGNLVFRQKDVDVEGYGADLEVERFYNSQLPSADNTEWGDGWTLAQNPELEPEKGAAPKEAELLDESGGLEAGVQLPSETGATKFSPALQAKVTKEAGGGYAITDESGETSQTVAFGAGGETEELRTGTYAKVDYDYEGGELAEIAVKDPAAAPDPSPAEEEAFEYSPPAPSFKSAFGTLGSGEGQLKAPGDVAVAANGDLFVLDKGNSRVERFNQEGKFLSKFGSEGTGNGQFKRPCSIAIDAAGNLYVADAGNNRIEKFNEKGEFQKAVGSAGTGNAQFKEPEGVAVDAKGNVLVADSYNQRVQKLNPSLEFLAKYGSSGTGNGQFSQVNSIDTGPRGNVWVTDWSLNRVTEFNEAGEFIQKFGASGTGPGQLSHPGAIEVDSRGDVFVGDQSNNRVQEFNQAGKYLTQFGAKGSGSGQFSLAPPMGIAVDNKGGLWVTDVSNNRIEKWSISGYRPGWYGAFGSLGSGDGQLKSPADVAFAPNGDLFVLDKGNNRIERFNREGKFLFKFGSPGTGTGQLSAPTSIAIDGSNHLWVADGANNRIQEFSESGEFIRAIGAFGSGTTQFNKPEGIATDLKGDVLVADTYNKRVQVFDEEGKFLFKFGSAGSGPGQFTEANAIDVGRHGDIYVADWGANRIEKFNEKGEYLLQFGSAGSGEGQFSHPDAIEADNKGNVWVGDQSNGRVELFNEAGEYLTQFGAKGSGEGQFSFTYPMGIVADSSGGLWITDVSNNRIQKWQIPSTEAPKPPEENDASVEVQTSAGLVTSVEGQEAGTHTYAHSGQLLTATGGPEGETKYEYDAAGRMTKVTLPNGTWGSIAYGATYGRVSKVTVDPAGSEPAKSTFFSYSDEPRRTTVTREDAPTVVYDIGEDGSVLSWQNVEKPPVFDNLGGNLYFFKEKEVPSGAQPLDIQAHADEGIASIQVIANGQNLVHETTCNENLETPEVECKTVKSEWVMETGNFPPGVLWIEVIVNGRLGKKESTASERFWVNVPQPPPPPPSGAAVRPKFSEVLSFREEFGLDIVDPVKDEIERNERIYNLLNAWTEEEPVARASWERWGVPLRPKDVAEMEYRERYVEADANVITEWAAAHYPTTYAGYYVDHKAGGVVRVGFTSNQTTAVEALKSAPGLIAGDRFAAFPTSPTYAYNYLEALQMEIGETDATTSPLKGLITRVGIDPKNNVVTVGATNPSTVAGRLATVHGSSAPISTYLDTEIAQPESSTTRWSDEVPFRNGRAIGFWQKESSTPLYWCTAGFGASERTGTAKNGAGEYSHFILTAGHCFSHNFVVRQFASKHDEQPNVLGTVTRRASDHEQDGFLTDGEAIDLNNASDLPSTIVGDGNNVIPVNGVAVAKPGTVVCISGATTDRIPPCKSLSRPAEVYPGFEGLGGVWEGPFYVLRTELLSAPGDSGAPIWTGKGLAVGLNSAGGSGVEFFTPLLPPPLSEKGLNVYEKIKRDKAPGVLAAPGMGNLHIATAR
jgi:YD repeat-containing protein